MKKRRGYLKHYNDSTAGISFQKLLIKKRPYSILLFWYILERCNQLNNAAISIDLNELKIRFHRRSDALLSDISQLSREVQNLSWSKVGDKLEIMVSNYAEYQESRGGKRVANSVSKEPTLKIKDKRLKIKDKNNKKSACFSVPISWAQQAYDCYPRKEGKTKGIEKLKTTIRSKDHWNEFCDALGNYVKKIEIEKPETKHIKLFSTFVNNWEDYLPKNYSLPKKKEHHY